jgi:hypothetical protein
MIAVERMFSMDVVNERACGMDVHKDNITACIITPEGKEVKTFSTKTVFLLKLIDWVKQYNCTHVAWKARAFIGNRKITGS